MINLNIVIQLPQILVFNSKIIYVHMDKQELYVNLVIIMEIYFGDKDFLIVIKDVLCARIINKIFYYLL